MDKTLPPPSALSRLATINRFTLLSAVLAGVAISACLMPGVYFVMPARDFFPLHTLLQFSSVLLAFMIFSVAWHNVSPTRSAGTTLLGCAMMASGLLDFAHTLSYSAMPDFAGAPAPFEQGMAFWPATQFTVAAALCGASFMSSASLSKPQSRYALLFGFGLYALLMYGLVTFHQAILPLIFVNGDRFTEFNIPFEFAVIGLFVVAASRFWRSRADKLRTYFFSAATAFIMSGILFVQHRTMADIFNISAHLYKIIGELLIYRAVYLSTIHVADDEIEQQQSRYRQLFDNMLSCCAVYRAVDDGDDFVFLEVNRAAERTEQMARDDFLGRRVTALFPNVADFGLLDVLRRVWRTGESEYFPAHYYQDGRIAGWRENYCYRLADGDVAAVYDDVTQRKLTDQLLQDSEKNFRILFEIAAIGMSEVDPMTGKFLRVNLKLCQITGYSAKELLSKTFAMITHPDDKERNIADWLRVVRGDVSEYATEKRYIHKDGHSVWVQLNVVALHDENGMVLRTLAAVADITARKQAEADRRRHNQELKSIFDALPDFYFRLRRDGTIFNYYANPVTKDDLYLPPEQFLGRRMADVLPPEQGGLFAAKFQELLNTGKTNAFEYPLSVPSGEHYYEARLANLGDSGDVIMLVRDIDDRKLLEQQLQQAQKMEALGQLTGGIAHDFNNILASVLGYSNLALERCVSDPSDKLARYLGEVISASERARDLVAKMLAYSRTSSAVANVPLDMVAEVKKTVTMLAAVIPAGIKITTDIESDVPFVRIDPIDLQQVLMNLAVNARDAIGEHGYIDITLERIRIKHKACAICHHIVDGDYVALEVKDSGTGIPAEIESRIFDPFFTTKEIGKGSGLGLSVVQGIVKKNKGHLLVETGSGQGASFRLLFPFSNAEPSAFSG